MANGISRRELLRKSAMIAGGAAGATLAAEIITPLAVKEKLVFDSIETTLYAKDQPKKNKPLDRNLEVDVAVIGGGYTGLSSAYHIKRLLPGKSVAIFEARGLGQGASGRNGGMLLPQPASEYMNIMDPGTHRRSYLETSATIKEISAIMNKEGLGSGIKLLGGMKVCVTKEGFEIARRYAPQAEAMGIPVELCDRKRLADSLGTDAFFGGIYDPNIGEVNPMKWVHALKKAVESAGCVIYEDSPVVRVDEGKKIRLTVEPAGGKRYTVTAPAIVLGTNAYTSRLGFMNRQILAVHTEIAATPPMGKNIFSELGWNRMPFSDDRKFLYHLGSTEDNRIVIGAGNVEYFFNNGLIYRKDIDIRRRALLGELVRIYPKLKGIDFEHVWSGLLDVSFDERQSVGVMGENSNIYYGIGYVGHGANCAFYFGKIIADLYAGKEKKWREMPFVNHRFPPIVVPEPLRYVGVKGYLGYLKATDVTI